jgi:glycosyltransferase involved in cell wall biosynthesis
MKLTILMPCLNEAETLAKCIRKAQLWLSISGLSGEVLIADNGSIDGSQDIAKNMGARVINVKEPGYGSALFKGCLESKGDWIVMGDSDDSYDFGAITPFVEKLNEGFDLVMGNRFLGGISHGAMPWKNRFIGNPLLTFIGRMLFKCPVKDFHCGLRGFTKNAFLRMDLRTTGMEFASEMVIKANLLGMKIAEVPTTLSKDGRSRPPHLRPWRDGWRHLRFMILFSPRWLFFIPGLLLAVPTCFFYILLLGAPLKIAHLTFDIHTLFYAQTGITLGVLSIIIGVMIRIFGMREGFLQKNPILEFIRTSSILEAGGIVSIFLIGLGVYLGLDLLAIWRGAEFGNLEPGPLLRALSVSTLVITLGGIGFLASLMMGFLGLPTRRQEL